MTLLHCLFPLYVTRNENEEVSCYIDSMPMTYLHFLLIGLIKDSFSY